MSGGKPARQRQITGTDEQRVQALDGQDLIDLSKSTLVFDLHAANDAIVTVLEVVRRRRRAPNVPHATYCRARVRQWD